MLLPECAVSFAGLADTRKVAMALPRTPASTLAFGALVAVTLAGSTAEAGDYVEGAQIVPATNRCAAFGPGFVDMGNGACLRADNHVHVEFGTRRAAMPSWSGGSASSAELRSEGIEIMPGVGTSHQLRVRNGLQTYDRY
ncbi:protein of unknown function [Beijerinckiaceae bacterium RH AL1]|jgi:microcystin degradation protein MlrC|nr:protein of unknown function [Beijerinckiaceae bacterium RH AL8]VVB42080.1 protein of unknown function [Beijerinckiaceae bacterium RH CH11]VVC53127.1 protein of unknown function [Beijerinckiaceae bacterium RH AL1]